MKAHLFLTAALICGGCATSDSAGEANAPVIRAGDASMTCRQIADEAATLSARMGGTPGGAVLGMARAGAAALIPGAGLLIAGADALGEPERRRREADQNRWHYLNGLYTANNCMQGAGR